MYVVLYREKSNEKKLSLLLVLILNRKKIILNIPQVQVHCICLVKDRKCGGIQVMRGLQL